MAKANYFGPIQSVKEAEDVVIGNSWALFGLGVLDIVVGFFVLSSIIVDGFIWITLAFLVNRFRTKLMVGILIVFAVISFGVTILAKIGIIDGGQNIFLAIIIVWASFRVWTSVCFLIENRVEVKPNFMNNYFFIIPVSIALVCLAGFLFWNSYLYRVVNNEITTTNTANVFTDTKFGYSIQFPKNWKLDRYIDAPGAIYAYNPTNEAARLLVWYKDSGPVVNQDQLLAFVEDDKKYGEEQQSIKTISLDKVDIGTHKAVKWRTLTSDSNGPYYVDAYYFYVPNPNPQTQAIWVWFVSAMAKTEAGLTTTEILNTLDTFKILD